MTGDNGGDISTVVCHILLLMYRGIYSTLPHVFECKLRFYIEKSQWKFNWMKSINAFYSLDWNKHSDHSTLNMYWIFALGHFDVVLCGFEKHSNTDIWVFTLWITDEWVHLAVFQSTTSFPLQRLSPSEVSSLAFIYSFVAGWICQFEQAKLGDWQKVGSKRGAHGVERGGQREKDKKDCDSHPFDPGCWVRAVWLVKSLC